MVVIAGNITSLAKANELVHGQGFKVLFAATSDCLTSHPTEDGKATDSCFTLIWSQQCGVQMVIG